MKIRATDLAPARVLVFSCSVDFRIKTNNHDFFQVLWSLGFNPTRSSTETYHEKLRSYGQWIHQFSSVSENHGGSEI